ncbi:MAG TPA: phosphoribosylformylglycinamidine cyclo-ligase [Candidatus Nitrosotalea sp.]|nr:phosphoribosylformylglycinamidine cyclo-ligase [Candidatus Nitrosotalea sp.]
MAITYKDAGIDIRKIKQSQQSIGNLIASTHKLQKKVKTMSGFGHYAGIVEMPGGTLLATHTDGVGTKVMIAQMMKKYDTVGIDCIAMNVNDIICTGAVPISFVDYIAANRNDQKIFNQIVRGLVKGATLAQVPIVGGETAILPDLIAGKSFSFDLAGMVVGILSKKEMILGNKIRTGDVIIGINSSGLHSNGYSLARKALLSRYSIREKIKGIGILGDALLAPTEIYVRPVLQAIKESNIHGLAHITGGAFTKLLRLKKTGFVLDNLPDTPPIFQVIEDQGVEKNEMYKTFNMGIGFCIIAPKDEAEKIGKIFKKYKFSSRQIGTISERKGVYVNKIRIA